MNDFHISKALKWKIGNRKIFSSAANLIRYADSLYVCCQESDIKSLNTCLKLGMHFPNNNVIHQLPFSIVPMNLPHKVFVVDLSLLRKFLAASPLINLSSDIINKPTVYPITHDNLFSAFLESFHMYE
ncbi:hypothetical protein CHS0354_018742 [Potamilus streckersoni]|uniref:Uncharacterized protein n=1 Tax=Potamilus streckersoni TaxID=2493646 RepID=A0AAE0W746_9BIVA|nr:hypothetical protein CHS0354_018742 [Potamilus streckersoni]